MAQIKQTPVSTSSSSSSSFSSPSFFSSHSPSSSREDDSALWSSSGNLSSTFGALLFASPELEQEETLTVDVVTFNSEIHPNNTAMMSVMEAESTTTMPPPVNSNHSCEGWLWTQGSASNFSILTVGIVADAVIVLLNCIVLLSFVMQRGIRKPSNFYILNLALCDLMTGINTIPYRFTMDVSGCWPYNSLIPCRISTTLSWVTINEAALTIVLIAYDRLLKVKLGAAFAQKETVDVVTTRLALSWIWNVAVWTVLNWVHVLTGISLSEKSACHTEFFQLPIEAVIVILMLSYFVPPLLCCIIYFRVWETMYDRRKKLEQKKRTQAVAGSSSVATTTGCGGAGKVDTPQSTRRRAAATGTAGADQAGECFQLISKQPQQQNGHHHHQLVQRTASDRAILPDNASAASVNTNDHLRDGPIKKATAATFVIASDNTSTITVTNNNINSATATAAVHNIVSADGSSRRRLAGGHLDRMTRMLILISCIFMVLWLPNGILAVTIGFVGREMQQKGRTQPLFELYTNLVRVTMIAQYCLYFNSAINPALYAFGFPAIREAMIKSVLPRTMWLKLFAVPHQQQQQQQQHPHQQSQHHRHQQQPSSGSSLKITAASKAAPSLPHQPSSLDRALV